MSKPHLILFHTDAQVVDSLRRDIDLAFVTAVQGNGKQATAVAHLDALYLTWMMAEQFGITPRLEPHRAFVLPMPDAMVEKGFPPLTVTGVSLEKDDSPDLAERLRITLEAIVDAMVRFEESGAGVIERLGAIPENLLFGKLPAATLSGILSAAWARFPE